MRKYIPNDMRGAKPQAGSFVGASYERNGAHESTGSRIRARMYLPEHIAFVPQILEQKRDCSQSICCDTYQVLCCAKQTMKKIACRQLQFIRKCCQV